MIDRGQLIDVISDLQTAREQMLRRSALLRWAMPALIIGAMGAVAALVAPAEWAIEPALLGLNALIVLPLAYVAGLLDPRLSVQLAKHVPATRLTVSYAVPLVATPLCVLALPLYFYDPDRLRLALLLSTSPMAVTAFAAFLNTAPLMSACDALRKLAMALAEAAARENVLQGGPHR